jgi:UDP-glucose 4-epimerase
LLIHYLENKVSYMKIFVTGGAGYIGSHTCVELQKAGCELVVFDNFSNSTFESLKRVMHITGKQLSFIQGDVRDEAALEKALLGCDAVIHFAGLKAVGESVAKPLEYYDNNVHGTLCLLRVMQKLNIKKLVFSSSATVYGDPEFLPFTENHPLRITNPYGQTKLVIEEILRDLFRSDPTWQMMILRYFNPLRAHESGRIGEDPQGIPSNGTGKRFRVLEVINTFSKVSGKEIPYVIQPRREGDIAEFYSDPSLASEVFGWCAKYDLDTICQDIW